MADAGKSEVWNSDQGEMMVIDLVADLFLFSDLSMPKNLRMVLVTDMVGPETGADENSTEADDVVGSVLFVV
jgi:hypothetical protein